MEDLFEWGEKKARSNLRDHGVSFDEAQTVFNDDFSITIPDPGHSFGEERFLIIGVSHTDRLLVVVFTERDDRIRLISAREAERHERRDYEEGII